MRNSRTGDTGPEFESIPRLDAESSIDCMVNDLVWSVDSEGKAAIQSAVVEEVETGDITASLVTCNRCAAACIVFHNSDGEITNTAEPPYGMPTLKDCQELPPA